MGTFVKLHFQRSVLNRLKNPDRSKNRMAMIIADEYQDLVSVGHGGTIGDDKICAKGREANFFFLAASQSILGAGFSYLAYKDKKGKLHKVQQTRIGNKNDVPLLTQPKVKRVWVEDKVNGKRFVKGHWEYIIEEQSSWSQK